MSENDIDRCCNNDALGLIFEYVGGFDLLTTIPFVCKRWRKVVANTPLQFEALRGWAFGLPDPLLANGQISVGILASTQHREYIPHHDLRENPNGLYKLIKNVYWYYTKQSLNDGSASNYILGTMKFSDDIPPFYFALEQTITHQREIVLHSNISELLAHGISENFKTNMKEQFFDKLQKIRLNAYKKKIRKSYR